MKNNARPKVQPRPAATALPANLLLAGTREYDGDVLYIHQDAYRAIKSFTKGKTVNESGGVLVGRTQKEFGKTHILIQGFIEAKFCDASPTALTFRHETWDEIHKTLAQKYHGMQIVGWMHTHPGCGLFFSENDRFMHANCFPEPWQVAYVVDPVKREECVYGWVNGKIERMTGFYIYDKTGVRISARPMVQSSTAEGEPPRRGPLLMDNVISLAAFLLMTVVAVILAIQLASMGRQLSALQRTVAVQESRISALESPKN